MKTTKILFVLLLLMSLFSCEDSGVGETVETSNILLPMEDIPYKFKRNEVSSVDYYEVDLLTTALDELQRFMRRGNMTRETNYNKFVKDYKEGKYYIKPEQQVASSAFAEMQKVRADVMQFIEYSRKIQKQQEAAEGVFGYVGGKVGFNEKIYVDDKGLAFAEVFSNMLVGAIYLDKILYLHLDEQLFENPELQKQHEDLELLKGKNCTELEHHWDLAYGYFTKIQWIAQANGLSSLKGVERKILDAFVWGRIELGNYRYVEMKEQLEIIRRELSRAFAIQTVEKIVGNITEVNYKEDPKQAFKYLSQAYAMMYSLRFTRKADGSHFFTYDEAKALQQNLLQEKGLWDTQRILAGEDTQGSLKSIAKEIKERYEL